MRTEAEISYHDFRQQIVAWIDQGKGSVTPAMVGKYLSENLSAFPRDIMPREIEILETSRDWDEAFGRISIAFPRSF